MENATIKFEVKRDSKITKEVSNRNFIPVVNIIKAKGIEFKDLLDGIPYDESYLLNKQERIEWSVFCRFISNVKRHFSQSDFERVGFEFVGRGTFIEASLGFLLFTSNKFSKLTAGKILKRITSTCLCLNPKIEFIGSNKIRFTLQLVDGYENIPEFFYANKGIFKALCKQAKLKEYKVDYKPIPQGAVYDISWKKESTFFKLKRGIHWLFNVNKAFWELTDSNEEIIREYEKLEDYKNNLEIKVEERTAELKKAQDELSKTISLLKEAQQVQNHFFTNISHEFRTPLTLILGPAKQIYDQSEDDNIKEQAGLISRNAKKLNKLANQLLDLSRIEAGKLKLKAARQNLIPVLKENFSSFRSIAESKNISLKLNCPDDKILIYLDKDKIDKIISNLLSNALKFTPKGGSVDVDVHPNGKEVLISITDSGIGIPANQKNKIFDRFYQVDNSLQKEYEGTGVGLSLTKELIELHKGKISVESEEGKGSVFKIFLPFGKEKFSPEEIVRKISATGSNVNNTGFSEPVKDKSGNDENFLAIDDINEEQKPLLLIIEDNREVRKYITGIMSDGYKIIEAANGEAGLNKSFEFIPDLIISDVMMPKKDGFRLCAELKSDHRTSHIPVILLTAKVTVKDKIEGLELGADEYIMKPFDAEELIARIKNLLEQRKRIQQHFYNTGYFKTDEKNITSMDREFLQKVYHIISEHIPDSSFGVERLAEKAAVSRSLLHKKLVTLVGEPPVEIIRRFRLNKAVKLIEGNSANITQIAFDTGFNDPSYFTVCFKKQFGVSPSKYNNQLSEVRER